MLQDVEAGRETEIDFLNGAIVAFGERYGVDAPLNRALTALSRERRGSDDEPGGDRPAVRERPGAGAGGRPRRGRRRRLRVHGLRGRSPLPLRLPDPPPLRLRRPAGRGRALGRLSERGALGRRPLRGVDRGQGLRRAPRPVDRRPRLHARSASTGSTTSWPCATTVRSPTVAVAVGPGLRPGARGQVRGGAGVGARRACASTRTASEAVLARLRGRARPRPS